MAAVPEGWAYKVLVEPTVMHDWADRDDAAPPARWVVFVDPQLSALLPLQGTGQGPPGLGVEEKVLQAVARLAPHLVALDATPARPGEHAAVRGPAATPGALQPVSWRSSPRSSA